MIMRVFNFTENIWDANPMLSMMPEFDKIYRNDRSKGKSATSTKLWACMAYMFEDEINPYHRMRTTERVQQIKSIIDNKFDPDDDKYGELITVIEKVFMTRLEREIAALWLKHEERSQLLDNTPYTLGNAKILDGLMIDGEKIYKILKRLQEELVKERAAGRNRGDYQESFIEKQLK